MNIKRGAIVGLALMATGMLGVGRSLLTPGDASGNAAHVVRADARAQATALPAPTPAAPEPIRLAAAAAPSAAKPLPAAAPVAAAPRASGEAIVKAPRDDCGDLFDIIFSPTQPGPTDEISFQILYEGAPGLRVHSVKWYWPLEELPDPFDPDSSGDEGEGGPYPYDAYVIAQTGEVVPRAVINTYEEAGEYDVAAVLLVEQLDGSGNIIGTYECQIVRRAFVEVAEVPTASFDATDMLADAHAVVPNSDWIPLFAFSMTSPEPPDFAYRTLVNLRYALVFDRFDEPPRPYDTSGGAPSRDNILEFALFRDFGPDGDPDQVYEPAFDSLFLTWDAYGYPYETPLGLDTQGNYVYSFTNNPNNMTYNLDFTFDATKPPCIGTPPPDPCYRVDDPYNSSNPMFPYREWVTTGVEPHNGYFVAVRLSSTWPSGRTLGYILFSALMYRYYDDFFTGERVVVPPPPDDSYPENLTELGENVGYSAAFNVFDVRGWHDDYVEEPGDLNYNRWNYQVKKYTPVAEFIRPRWDISNTALNFVSAEFIDLRELFAIENWAPLLGIDAHGYFIEPDGSISETAQPIEVNVVFTDIGGDPFGPPGNGGFDPREGLDTFTASGRANPDGAGNFDYAFNGVWMYHDTNGNGIFDAPVQGGGGGVSFSGRDYPMYPDVVYTGDDFVELGHAEWEYIPFPPGGGDPWWKIRFRMAGGRRRCPTCTPTGYMEAIPDAWKRTSFPKPDYFIVMRPDSGFKDISGVVGDGVGLPLGADTRVFIEPRRWNPWDGGHWDGGILLNNQMLAPPPGSSYWQDDPQLDQVCTRGSYPCPSAETYCPGGGDCTRQYPWWTERTQNQDTNKPVRGNIEIHDLVLTYSTDSRNYGKQTSIMVGQEFDTNGVFWTNWVDPFGFMASRFFNGETSYIFPDNSVHQGGFDDDLTNTQYAFETVPFKLTDENVALGEVVGQGNLRDPRSFFFPNPPEQPTLPKYSFWPPGQYSNILAYGEQSYCYLADDHGNNEPYHRPPTSQSQATYEDDEYVFVMRNPVDRFGNSVTFGTNELAGMWLVDRLGAKFRIAGNTGNALTLVNGHGAYVDKTYEFRTEQVVLNVTLCGEQYSLPTYVNNDPGKHQGELFAFVSGFPSVAGVPIYFARQAEYYVYYYSGDVAPFTYDSDGAVYYFDCAFQPYYLDNFGYPEYPVTAPTPLGVVNYSAATERASVYLPEYPYVGTYTSNYPSSVPRSIIGQEWAIRRGAYLVVRDALPNGSYPRMSDWPEGWGINADQEGPNGESRAARLLKQYVEFNSQPTAMLGINLTATDDVIVNNENPIRLESITVAFWGPEFDRTDLASLDSAGTLVSSGVLLYEDTTSNGVFDGPVFFDVSPTPSYRDRIVPLQPDSLKWSTKGPEPIDLDGDLIPDDMSGDGVVTANGITSLETGAPLTAEEIARWDGLSDLAWVVELRPATLWTVPQSDERNEAPNGGAKSAVSEDEEFPGATVLAQEVQWPSFWAETPTLIDLGMPGETATAAKALRAGGHRGDDLFVVVRTSKTIGAFEEFRCVVPAKLPTRSTQTEKTAGVRFSPRSYPVVGSFEKVNPDEGAVQDWYGHDMLAVNVPAKIYDLSDDLIASALPGSVPVILPGGPPRAILGIDVSANRPNNLIAQGESSSGGSFIPTAGSVAADSIYRTSQGWTANAVGLWIVAMGQADSERDSRLESFQITAVNGNELTFRAGAPRSNSRWFMIKDPTFLEQVVVELYDTNRDGLFNLEYDLMKLDHEDPANGLRSGVSLYRDNDLHPRNTNDAFDPPVYDENGNFVEYIDLPVRLDDPPILIGTSGGEPGYQVKFVFSSPGTDNLIGVDSMPYEAQPRLRQWVPQTFGQSLNDANYGSDFFVVVRPSRNMSAGDDFSAAIVSWGPNTPSEPDPDNFSVDLLGQSGQREDEFDKFSEFPWGSRGLGFITFFKDPPPLRYWTYNKALRRIEPRTEVDHSQDQTNIRYWIRTNPSVAGRTKVITSLAAPTVDFVADRLRQIPGATINFKLITTGSVVKVVWSFGDGTTSTTRDPAHVYTKSGFYTVSVTVTDRYGISVTEEKVNYIEIVDAPFVDFVAVPTRGAITPDYVGGRVPGLDVQFTDLSVGTTDLVAQAFFWNFGDNTQPTERTQQNPIHRYTQEGFYTVTLEVTFLNTVTNDLVVRYYTRENYIIVLPCVGCQGTEGEGEGEGEEENPADFSIEGKVRDKEALVPLTDWVPLFQFSMGYPADTPAPRVLRTLRYTVRPDQREPDALMYGNLSGPDVSDILEFGLFFERDGGDEGDKELDVDNDYLLYTWDNTGFPLGELLNDSPFSGLQYDLDFIGNGSSKNPDFPVPNGPDADDGLSGYSYIVAVRTSATWRSQVTMNCRVDNAEMILVGSGMFPVNQDGDPIDSYSPNFREGEVFEEDASYSSSFTVWDTTGTPSGSMAPGFFNVWNHPGYLYTPAAEHTRPRWNKFDQLLDITAGEILEIRKLLSLDSWVDVIGINLHSTKALHFTDYFDTGNIHFVDSKDAAQLREVNVVLTDIGADPLGPEGNGGFDPRSGLDTNTWQVYGSPVVEDQALAPDITYNGIWVWHDTNNNGVFDAPTPLAGGGIQYNGDYPLFPEYWYLGGSSLLQPGAWEYVPFPPGGGDPWWRISLRFFGGRRRGLDAINADDNVEGYLEKTPDNLVSAYSGSEYINDYFVVVRTDSGFQDVSLGTPDGGGITMGADFRAFIEPRRIAAGGHGEGGILVDSMIPALDLTADADPWQDDARWLVDEPWWPERTLNANAAKPLRVGLDVHDLVLTYESDSVYRKETEIFFGWGPFADEVCMGFSYGFGAPTDFEQWMDPFSLARSRFLNGHSVGVTRWRLFGWETITLSAGGITGNYSISHDESDSSGQYVYETVPFNETAPPYTDTRSAAYPQPPAQPVLPDFSSWPATQRPGEYPRASDWAPEDARARLLTQKADAEGDHTALLGLNLVGSSDPQVNGRNETNIAQINIAFWGPDFSPSDLLPLDPKNNGNLSYDSGVLLWEDTDGNGVFFIGKPFESFLDIPATFTLFDDMVPIRNLAWGSVPELIDLDGDGVADDMNGDSVVDDRDKAWVLTFQPEDLWDLPHEDGIEFDFSVPVVGCGGIDFGGSSASARALELRQKSAQATTAKALDVTQPQPGDDLFITVRASASARRFEQFRAVVPATLPARPLGQRKAGIQFYPQVNTSASAFTKSSPDEDSVQDFFGHDMLEINVPARIVDMTNQTQTITIGGAALPILGLDLSTNRPEGTRASGSNGVGSPQAFTVPGATWTVNAYAGDWLLDSRYEAYQIISNTANRLTLLSGEPPDGAWRIVQDPTFLEQVIVEFYNEGQDADFSPLVDLLPLDIDQNLSGVALYRDNDLNPNNRNGLFDPAIDIPVPLDTWPEFVGQTAEDIQVKFVFCAPGTDNLPAPLAQQPRNRQWVPDTFGSQSNSAFYGPDFFVVVRASQNMRPNDNFRAGIVSWGPNTPTEPDPDIWAGLPGEERNDFSKFEEFPWGARGLGFITFFKEPSPRYFLDGKRAGVKLDNSGFNWIRSHSAKKGRCGVVKAVNPVANPYSLIITSASTTKLPSQTLPGQGFSFVIMGSGFGTNPTVILSGYDVVVDSATDTQIKVTISTSDEVVPQEPIVLIVRRPAAGVVPEAEASRTNLFTLVPGSLQLTPKITRVSPSRGTKDVFPVTVLGSNFDEKGSIEVVFGRTLMPVLAVSADGTQISVGFPAGGLPDSGPLNVRVVNSARQTEDILVDGFDYVNSAKQTSSSGCAAVPGEDGGRRSYGDAVTVLAAGILLTVGTRRRRARWPGAARRD